jgi:hypothetical protein
LVLTLDNGQIWQQKTADRAMHVKVGDQVTISAACSTRSCSLPTPTRDRCASRGCGDLEHALHFERAPLGVDMRNEFSAARVTVTS